MDYKAMIQRRLDSWGFHSPQWEEDDEYEPPRPVAVLGKARPVEEDEDRHLYSDMDYELTVHVVGSEDMGTLRVVLTATEEGMDRFSGDEVGFADMELI